MSVIHYKNLTIMVSVKSAVLIQSAGYWVSEYMQEAHGFLLRSGRFRFAIPDALQEAGVAYLGLARLECEESVKEVYAATLARLESDIALGEPRGPAGSDQGAWPTTPEEESAAHSAWAAGRREDWNYCFLRIAGSHTETDWESLYAWFYFSQRQPGANGDVFTVC